jgi:hypothetical protein
MFGFLKSIKFAHLLNNHKSKTFELVLICIDIATKNNNSDPSYIIKQLIKARAKKISYKSKQIEQLNIMYNSLIEFGARTRYKLAFTSILLIEANIYMMSIHKEHELSDLIGDFIDGIEPMQQLINHGIPAEVV